MRLFLEENRQSALVRLLMNPGARVGVIITVIFMILVTIGPTITPYDPIEQELSEALLGVSWKHPLGTDWLGRDMLARLASGARLTFVIILGTTLPACIIGVTIGFSAGYLGGKTDLLVMRLIDVSMAFPGILLALAIVSVLGPGLFNMVLAISIYLLPRFVRISRGTVMSIKNMQYVDAAVAIGSSQPRILIHHILPNSAPPIIVQLTIEMGVVVIISAGLSFLGLGVQRPTPEWGLMLNDGRQYLQTSSHVALAPGIAIVTLVLGINLLGEGINRVMRPTKSA